MNPHNYFQIHIRKQHLKFSAAHATVFPGGKKEALHGHNYQVDLTVDLKSTSFENMISFSIFKTAMQEICNEWDEKILIAKDCPSLKIISHSNEIEFLLCNKRYVLPADEVVLLSLENITTETLAKEYCTRLLTKLDPTLVELLILGIALRIDETVGQGATYVWKNPHASKTFLEQVSGKIL